MQNQHTLIGKKQSLVCKFCGVFVATKLISSNVPKKVFLFKTNLKLQLSTSRVLIIIETGTINLIARVPHGRSSRPVVYGTPPYGENDE